MKDNEVSLLSDLLTKYIDYLISDSFEHNQRDHITIFVILSNLEFHSDDSVHSERLEVRPELEVVHDGTDEYRQPDLVPGEGLPV